MKSKVFSFLILFLLLSSCEKDYPIPSNEVPGWLKSSIENDEQAIKDFPKSWKNYGVWFRYNYDGVYYFEYGNPLSSSIVPPISQAQDTLNFLDPATSDRYQNRKCCQRLVWKGPKYDDLLH